MPNIRIEAFAKKPQKALFQAIGIRRVVHQDQEWLRTAQPGTLSRYGRSLPRAVKSVTRIGNSTEVRAFVIKYDRAVRGIATIIRDQTIVFDDGHSLTGNDLDYWSEPGSNDNIHSAIGEALVAKSLSIDRSATMFATIDVALDPHRQPYGLIKALEPLAMNVVLSAGEAGDPFGVTRGGVGVNVYSRAPQWANS